MVTRARYAGGASRGVGRQRYRLFDGFNPSKAVALRVSKFKNCDEATFARNSGTFERRSGDRRHRVASVQLATLRGADDAGQSGDLEGARIHELVKEHISQLEKQRADGWRKVTGARDC